MKNPSTFSILFDVGGVLRDSKHVMWKAFKKAFDCYDIPLNLSKEELWHLRAITPIHSSKKFTAAYLSKKEKLRELLDLPYKDAKKIVINLSLINHPKTNEINKLYKKYFNKFAEKAAPLPANRKEFLETLKERGFKLGIVSNAGKGSVYRDLEEEINLFDVIITGEDIQTAKPSPEGIIRALNELKIDPKNALFVGDTEVDALAAERAGVRFVGVETGMMTKKWWAELGYNVVEGVEKLEDILRS